MSILYWTANLWGSAKPTAAQVRAGRDSSNGILDVGSFGNQTATLSGTGTFTWTVGATGLSSGVNYYFAAVTDLGNDASVVTSPMFTMQGVHGTSTGTFTLAGTATTATIARTVTGASTGTFTLANTVTSATVSAGSPMTATSTGTFTLANTVTSATVSRTVTGTSAGTFTLANTATTGTVAGATVNPPWVNVVVQLHNDGSGTFIDSSGYGWTTTNVSATHGTPAKFGDAAQLFPGYFTIPDSPVFDFGTNDLTIELQIYKQAGQSGTFIGWSTAGGNFDFGLGAFDDLTFTLPGGGTGRTAVTISPAAYTYIVATRASGRWTIWQNLTQVWTDASGPATSFDLAGLMYFGRGGIGATYGPITNGLMDEVRITKGIALYTTSSPPTQVPTSPFPDGPPLFAVNGTSTGTFTLANTATTATVAHGAPVNASSTRSFTLANTLSTGTIQFPALPVNGSSTGIFTLANTATTAALKVYGLWRIIYSVEKVPFPGTTTTVFTRITWNGYDPVDTWVAGSQSFEDCYAQTLSNFQSRQQPSGPFVYTVIGP